MQFNPYSIVGEFERNLADWTGAKYCVCVESCSAAILLSLLYRREQNGVLGRVSIPPNTYPSLPCSIILAGGKVYWDRIEWEGEYELYPYRIFDSALRLKKGMYDKAKSAMNSLVCVSFHWKKLLKLGRGGAVLTDDEKAYEWLKRARFDGRNPVPLQDDNFTQLGLNVYMEPANAARGIQLFEIYKQNYPEGADDLKVSEQGYNDLSKYKIYNQ